MVACFLGGGFERSRRVNQSNSSPPILYLLHGRESVCSKKVGRVSGACSIESKKWDDKSTIVLYCRTEVCKIIK